MSISNSTLLARNTSADPGGGLAIGGATRRLLVALPALNEERTVGDVVRAVPAEVPGIDAIDVLVIDDGSQDRTGTEAAAAGATVVHHGLQRGVGAAFHTALAYGLDHGADILVTIDSDGQFDPRDIPRLIEPVVAGRADFATASRFLDEALLPDMPAVKIWGNRMMSRLISSLAGKRFYDVSCGMRCYSRRAMLQLHLLARFTYTQEVILNLSFKDLRIEEVPIRVRGEREFGESRVASSLWRYALRTVQIIFRCYRDYHPLRFFGGLALMLLVPAVALAAFLGWKYLETGAFSPFKWAGALALTLTAGAGVLLHVGIIGDMLNRHRIYLEEILFRQRSESGKGPSP
ncbi:MAG: glycosyltransferase family 2 protein [Acidobacteria bacterium]|nr:MAG: glycosyltransferase family 2 protein [Acidobacteriota bacterium]REK08908.1 MAG: glycosyltransferase family 2 protein [Acidobacteriota bacterium]